MPLKVWVTQNSMLYSTREAEALGDLLLPSAPCSCQRERGWVASCQIFQRRHVMAFPRDQISYSAIVDRPALRLPKSARLVVWVIGNVEEWDIQGPMPRTVLPPPGGAQVIPDVPN